MKPFLLGVLTGCVVAALVVGLLASRKAAWLSHYRFELVQPPVPATVLDQIRSAEAGYYASAPAWRRALEEAQDALAIMAPNLVYRLNLSVGPYRMKARTVEEMLSWAIASGYLRLRGETRTASRAAIAYFAEQPVLSDWEAAIYIAWLRESHPGLAGKPWADIAESPMMVAKIYSGYMGAGGDMERWRSSLEPGSVALERLGIEGDR
jgi:hypothetical protein